MTQNAIPAADYATFLSDLADSLRKLVRAGQGPTVQEVVALLRVNEDNRIIRSLCVELDLATKAEFDREVRRARVREVLGTAPSNATELVEAFVGRHAVKMRLDGMFTREVQATYRTDDGTVLPITKADRDAADVDLYAAFHCDAKARMTRMDVERELRILSSNYRLGIGRDEITDAVDEWTAAARRARLHDIFVGVEGREPHFDTPMMWERFAERVFDCSETSPAFVAAVLRKFVWQVKRKLRGLPVTDHLMPVILGPQGIGKSTLVNKLLGPVEELKLNVDFQMVVDERNVEIWSSYVMFLDEMGYASKADIDSVKNIITATTLTRRPMRSNAKITIDQNATLIGCSNRELGQLVRDPTGIRRFVGVRMRSDADRQFINTLNWSLMWGGVGVNDADPLADHRAVLTEQQEESRERGRVEQWMFDFTGANNAYQAGVNKAGNIAARDLYLAFREYEEEAFPGHFKTSKTDFDYEMARLRKNSPEAVVFEKKPKGAGGAMYRWVKESHLRLVD